MIVFYAGYHFTMSLPELCFGSMTAYDNYCLSCKNVIHIHELKVICEQPPRVQSHGPLAHGLLKLVPHMPRHSSSLFLLHQ